MCRPRPSNTLKWTLLLFIFNVQYGCCQNTTGDAPVDSPKDEAVDNDVAVLVLGAVGGILAICIILIILTQIFFKTSKKDEKSELEGIELDKLNDTTGSYQTNDSRRSSSRNKLAQELQSKYPQFTIEELVYLLKVENWNINNAEGRIISGAYVSIKERESQPGITDERSSQHSGSRISGNSKRYSEGTPATPLSRGSSKGLHQTWGGIPSGRGRGSKRKTPREYSLGQSLTASSGLRQELLPFERIEDTRSETPIQKPSRNLSYKLVVVDG